jgi:hypothetical protein
LVRNIFGREIVLQSSSQVFRTAYILFARSIIRKYIITRFTLRRQFTQVTVCDFNKNVSYIGTCGKVNLSYMSLKDPPSPDDSENVRPLAVIDYILTSSLVLPVQSLKKVSVADPPADFTPHNLVSPAPF